VVQYGAAIKVESSSVIQPFDCCSSVKVIVLLE